MAVACYICAFSVNSKYVNLFYLELEINIFPWFIHSRGGKGPLNSIHARVRERVKV